MNTNVIGRLAVFLTNSQAPLSMLIATGGGSMESLQRDWVALRDALGLKGWHSYNDAAMALTEAFKPVEPEKPKRVRKSRAKPKTEGIGMHFGPLPTTEEPIHPNRMG